MQTVLVLEQLILKIFLHDLLSGKDISDDLNLILEGE